MDPHLNPGFMHGTELTVQSASQPQYHTAVTLKATVPHGRHTENLWEPRYGTRGVDLTAEPSKSLSDHELLHRMDYVPSCARGLIRVLGIAGLAIN